MYMNLAVSLYNIALATAHYSTITFGHVFIVSSIVKRGTGMGVVHGMFNSK